MILTRGKCFESKVSHLPVGAVCAKVALSEMLGEA